MKSKVVTPETICVTSVRVTKSGFGILFIDKNSIIWILNCRNAALSSFTRLIQS